MTDEQLTSNIVAVSAIIGLVVLNIYGENVPDLVNFGLIGAALGAKIEDLRNTIKK